MMAGPRTRIIATSFARLRTTLLIPKEADGISFADLIQTKGPDSVDLTCPNFSYEWPGYEIATGGYLDTMPEGSTKKVAILMSPIRAFQTTAWSLVTMCFVKAQ